MEDLVTEGLQLPRGLALDAAAGRLYWIDNGSGKIQRAHLDGSDVEDLVTSGLKESHGLALGAGLPAQILNVEGEPATLDLTGRFRDPEGGALTLTASSSDEAVAAATLADSVVTIAPVTPGQVTVSVTARDEGGRHTTLPVAVTVYPANRPPVAGTLADRKIRIGSPDRVELSDAFTDPDETDVLTYTAASSNEAVATAAVEGTGLRITPRKTGQTRIAVTARDPKGLEAALSFAVTVEPKPPPKPPPPPPPGSSSDNGGGGPVTPPPPTPPPPRPPPPPPPPPGPNRAPAFNDGPSTSRSVAENTAGGQDIQHPISATDEDRDRLTYRLSGDDADSFTLNTSNGQLRTRSGVTYDYEDKDRYSVTVEADDRRGAAASIDVTIYVADVDEPPEAPARPRVEPASSTSLTVTWTEPVNTGPGVDGYDVQYRKSGSFLPWPHSGSGTSTTITDLDLNTRYEVQVRATNDEGTGGWSASGFGTTSANQRPVFDEGGSATRSLAENTPPDRSIGNPIRATDPEGRAVTYRLTGGDTDQFTIDPNNGQLRTQTGVEYNYEVQNRYSVTVEAQDEQGGRATIAVTIDITDDDNERPQRPDRPSVTASTLTSLTLRWTEPANPGPPIIDYNVQYREGSSGAFTAAAHDGIRTTTTIANLESDTSYEIQVQATSDEGTSQWSPSGNGRTVANQAPTFTEGSSTTRRLAENTTGAHNIGNPITASDGDGGTLTYHLEGTDRASFSLDVNQLQTQSGETYDYEEKPSYVVIVRVEDGQGGSNTIEVTINLIDEQEPPGDPAAPSVIPASSTSLTVTWDEPANTGPDIDDYDVQYREGGSGGFTSWTHNSAERTATITGRSPGTSYEVQVRARNAEGTSDWSPSGTGSTHPNQPPVFTDGSSATRRLDENTTDVQNIGDPVSATDSENTTLTYSLEGTDKDAFTIDTGSGQLRTKSDQTYDHEATPRYVLSIKATDGHGGSSTILVLINLNDVNEPPAFTSDATFETVENGTRVGAVVARDEDSADDITNYTITGGADRDLFEIAGTNQLRFKDAPDFERPADAGGNNEYIVEVTATGGTGTREMTGTQTITVTVEDVDEPPGKPDPPTVSDETESSLTVTWTEPANTGPDVTNYHVQYRISGAFIDWPDTGPSLTRTITGLSSGSTYQIRVQAENDEGKGAWSNSVNGTTLTGPLPTITILRDPYLQSGTSSSVIIKWRTDEATESVVHYGLDPNSLTLSASNSTSTTEHAVQLTGLSADVKYFYSVGTSSVTLAGGDRDHFVVTAPLPGTAKPTRIWVIGDSGTADRNARAVRDAFLEFTGSRDPDLWIMLGDNAYYHGTDNEYQRAVFNTYSHVLPRTVLWPTLGNHGTGTADSATESGPYYDIFSLPRNGEAGGVASVTEAYYSFDYGNMHFVCLNSETDLSPDGAMMTWLEADLAANDKEWIIAFWHRPPYSRGSANSDTYGQQSALRQNAVPILERYGVDLVLTGHTHAYERSYLIDGHYGLSDTFTDAMKKNPGDGSATGDGTYQKPATVGAPHAGAVYVVAGNAGLIKTGGSLDHPAMAVSFRILGSMVLDVNGNRLDAIFLGSTGDIWDAFTILKVPDTTSPQISSVQAQGTPARAVVTFSENVEQAISETASNYAIDNGVTVSAAGLGDDGRTVTLTTAPLTQGITYTLTVNNVVDLAGNPIATDSQEQFQYNIITDSFQDGVAPTAGYGEP